MTSGSTPRHSGSGRPKSFRSRQVLLAIGVGTGLLMPAGVARARTCESPESTCINSDVLWPRAGATQFFGVGPARTLNAGGVGLGITGSLQHAPLILRKAPGSPGGITEIEAVGTQLVTSLAVAWAATHRLEFNVVAPFTAWQEGSGLSSLDGPSRPIPSAGVRDLRLGAAYALIGLDRRADADGFGLVARADLAVPTGDRDSFGGERTVAFAPSLTAEGHLGRVTLGAEAGARLRGKTWLADGRRVGNQLYLAMGASVAVDPRRTLALSAEVFALPSTIPSGVSPIQWLTGIRWSGLWASDLVLHAGGGGSFRSGPDAEPLEPSWRFVFDARYSPLGLDTDGDGILDRHDRCPNEREDRDGFHDDDGCPDNDDDSDGIPDLRDRCPREAEDIDGFQDDDGCPEPDADADGIKDVVDRCPTMAEDKNGFEDEDGCPDNDRASRPAERCADGSLAKVNEICDIDRDGIADQVDRCPQEAEDRDGIADDDGCPEKDADEDGVGDTVDRCPLEPESIDGKDDDDGCPEPSATSQVSFVAGAIETTAPIRFGGGSSTPSKVMKAQVTWIAQRLQGLVDRGVDKVVVEAWSDKAGESPANQALAQKRAQAIVDALVAAGVPEALVRAKVGDLEDPPAPPKANWLVTVRTRRKDALPTTSGAPSTPAPATPATTAPTMSPAAPTSVPPTTSPATPTPAAPKPTEPRPTAPPPLPTPAPAR